MMGNGIVTSVGRPAMSSGIVRIERFPAPVRLADPPHGTAPSHPPHPARAPSGSRPTAANCTVASAAPTARAPSGSRPTARNCTVASAAPTARATSSSRPTAANCTVASAAPGAGLIRLPAHRANCTVASAAPGARARPAPGPPHELHRRIRRTRRLPSLSWRLADGLGLLIGGRGARPDPASAFAAGQREQPRAQHGRVGQIAERRSRDDERVRQGLGGLDRVGQLPVAVAVQVSRVPVVGHGDTRRVSRPDRRDNLAIVLLVVRRVPGWAGVVAQPGRAASGAGTKRPPGRIGRRAAEAGRERSPGRFGGRPADSGGRHLPGGAGRGLIRPGLSWPGLTDRVSAGRAGRIVSGPRSAAG